VHLIGHSHTDIGWSNTIEGYFYRIGGTSADTASMGSVNIIITTIINALIDDSSRAFSWSEMKFFVMWWDQ